MNFRDDNRSDILENATTDGSVTAGKSQKSKNYRVKTGIKNSPR